MISKNKDYYKFCVELEKAVMHLSLDISNLNDNYFNLSKNTIARNRYQNEANFKYEMIAG